MIDQSTASKPRDPRALNAYRHGLTGQIHLVTPAEQVAYEKHCRGYLESLAPAGALETDLAQSIADDRWRLKRAVAIEQTIFAMGLGHAAVNLNGNPEVEASFAQARTWLDDGKDLQLLGLYEHRIQSRVNKNMQMLRQLQQDRKAALEQAAEEAALLAELAESKGEAYDVERDFPVESLPPQFVFSKPEIASLAAHRRRLAEAKMQSAAPPKTFRQAA
ncbi:MAG: hypothetical protein ACLQVN_06160 [Bryobacteraceae bacterium]